MDFLITGLPRSGLAWSSVWLMDGALCLHDPLYDFCVGDLYNLHPGQKWGAACSGLWMFPSDIKAWGCPVVILERSIDDIQHSCQIACHGKQIPQIMIDKFANLEGPRFNYKDLFIEQKA